MLDSLVRSIGETHTLFWLGGSYFTLILGERAYHAVRRTGAYADAESWCSFWLTIIDRSLKLISSILIPFVLYAWVYEHFRFFTIENLALSLALAFLVHDLSYYWDHRLAHRVGLLWAMHAVHHSGNSFNHTTSGRGFHFDALPRRVLDLAGALLGVPPAVFVTMAVLKDTYGIWNHASYVGDLGWAERIFATPRNHLVHHAREAHNIDKNFSQVLILWDKLFGTFEPYREPITPGLVKPVYDTNALTAQFAGFQQLWERMRTADRWQDRLAYLWMPPEWSHARAQASAMAATPAE